MISVFDVIIDLAILFVEAVGVGVLLFAVAKALLGLFVRRDRIRLELAEGIALALEFKMGSELLRTLIVRDWNELLILGSVIILRAALTFLIQWEIGIEKRNDNVTKKDRLR